MSKIPWVTGPGPHTEIEVPDKQQGEEAMPVSPSEVTCPVCNAPPGKPCNAPTDTGRRDVRWYHFNRISAAQTPGFTCPKCGRTSYNQTDVSEGYCGACYDWTGRTIP